MVDTKDQSNAIVYCVCLSRLDILVFVVLAQHLIQSIMRCENSRGKASNVPSALWV